MATVPSPSLAPPLSNVDSSTMAEFNLANTAAVLPASGTGTRTGAATAKQFWLLDGRPLMYYTLQTFESLPWLDAIVVPVSASMLPTVQAWHQAWGLRKTKFIEGGTTRHRSIAAGLGVLSSDIKAVIIHDMVRPFVDADILRRVTQAAREHGAAGATLGLVSTVIKPDADGFLDQVLTRSEYRASQTPQAFRYDVIQTAYNTCTEDDFEHGTEVLKLALDYGKTRAKLVPCQPNVWKVTYKHDLYAAEAMVKQAARQVAIIIGGSRGIGKHTARLLKDRGMTVIFYSLCTYRPIRSNGQQVYCCARHDAELVKTCRELDVIPMTLDASVASEVTDLYAKVMEDHGRVDVVVNCAGSGMLSSIADTDDDSWKQIIDGNLNLVFYSCRAALRAMRTQTVGGLIINLGSSSASGGRIDQGAYAASKAGVQCLTETVALEGKEHGVVAYCVVPRRTFTQLRLDMFPKEDASDCLAPEAVAEVIVSLVNFPNPLLTGQAFYAR
eukprot:m.85038 g.85038  ORF g.85038 m.85038 type:complete len:499 (-) comp14703_c0_seq4:57-1553(-)